MAVEARRKKPTAVFMAFGTKGDVYPIAAIAAAFASDQKQYEVAFVTHSAHENLKGHLGAKGVEYVPISSPPVLSSLQQKDLGEGSFILQKKEITRRHRQECLSTVERIYGEDPIMDGDLIIINFFALEGWSLAELFHVQCVVAAPYVVPYSAPSSFERQFRNELPHLYKYLREAPTGKIGWDDVIHWMWPLFTEDWGTWRSLDLHLSFWPFTVDPVTGLPTWHVRPSSPLLLGHTTSFMCLLNRKDTVTGMALAKKLLSAPVTGHQQLGFVVLVTPVEWQFSCARCAEISSLVSLRKLNVEDELCSIHAKLQKFLDSPAERPIFISLSSVGSMGYLRNPQAFLRVLGNVLNITNHKFILFSAGYGPLDAAIKMFAQTLSSDSEQMQSSEIQSCLFDGRLFCFSGVVPYSWLFPRCAAAIHHGGSGSTAAALRTGIPQVCSAIELVLISSVSIVAKLLNAIDCFRKPHSIDQFYWAERMFWLGVAPETLNSACLLPDKDDDTCISKAANVLVGAINYALSPEVKLRATQIADRISTESKERMSKGRGSALVVATVVVMISMVVVFQCEVAEAAIYTVGGGGGWTFNVAAWPKGKRFKAGDTLVFNYNPAIHNVVAVNKGGYNSCTTPRGAKVYQTGKDQIKLVKGPNFFICNIPGHCQSGMKIAINAM
ncbi:hypothetical protein DH2020_030836 [Rehmannia glutinosa]|uniref:Phytocyanin domain-containing protein n=1 Tax=Rehmannia glutinosa TaxID=99300 RepID=A0ABR0VN36_REHGL